MSMMTTGPSVAELMDVRDPETPLYYDTLLELSYFAYPQRWVLAAGAARADNWSSSPGAIWIVPTALDRKDHAHDEAPL